MLNTKSAVQMSWNKLILIGFIILSLGFVGGYYLNTLKGMKSSANKCSQATSDVNGYLTLLINNIKEGKGVTHLQMNILIDLIEIENECIDQLFEQNSIA